MDTVWIAHPKLPDRKVEVPASALPQHQRSGWRETDAPPPDEELEPDPPTQETDQAPADAGAFSLPEAGSRVRRTTRGEQ